MIHDKKIINEFIMAEKFIKEFLSFFFIGFRKEKKSKDIDDLNELLKFNEKSKFLILPTKENIIPLPPKDKTNNFYPFKKEPEYILRLQPNFKTFSSTNLPILIEFLCQNRTQKFNKKFILKNAEDISKEIFVGNFINFLNLLFSQDKFLREKSMHFPSYSMINLTQNVVLIEFLDNTNSFDKIYSSYLEKCFPNLSQARKQIKKNALFLIFFNYK